MSKTRKCRLNDNELAIHEMAVKLRKKTDEQLVEVLQQTYDQGYQNGLEQNKVSEGELFVSENAKMEFLSRLKAAPGVGKAIYDKIEKIFIQENDRGDC